MVTVWSKRAKAELQKAYLYILIDSYQNALKVKDDPIEITLDLSKHPEKYPIDKFKESNDGTWRAFEKHNFRVSYRIMPNQMRIVRLRHTSRFPQRF
jgi:plasmid stabilization system protein ParE